MRYYPIFMNLSGKSCLVVGAGQVGVRKIRTLLDCGAGSVTVVDPAPPSAALSPLLAAPALHYEQRSFHDPDVDGKWLVIASTSNEDVNWRISSLCNARGVLCNIVDQPEKCSFIVPATITRGDLTLAISTGGQSPALAKKIRQDLESGFGDQYGAFLELMGRLRPLLLGLGRPTPENTATFRAVIHSGLLDAMTAHDAELAEAILRDLLPEGLHPNIPELLHDLA
ncbi:MAG: bifunctional precorrin-2 dehydrogenase/sirohydrochlorin ferrochelatase [Desulfovibrionaceae bacterium]